jgi:hypothetical protein
MKKIIIPFILIVLGTTITKAQVEVSGKFIKEKGSYVVYEKQPDSSYNEIFSEINERDYLVELDTNKTYVFKFTNKENIVKYMTFISYQSKNVILDVEFMTTLNATVVIKNDKVYMKRINKEISLALN